LPRHFVIRADRRARDNAGSNKPIKSAIIEITTSNSISVNPDRFLPLR